MDDQTKHLVEMLHFHQPIKIRGETVPAQWDQSYEKWKVSFLPPDFAGKSVLDVGCNNGYFSFLAEERGATDIVAIDDPWDAGEQCVDSRCINLAILLNESRVRYRTGSVYGLAELQRRFDIVIFFDVLYHLKYPFLALEQLAEVCAGDLYLCTLFIPGEGHTAEVRRDVPQDYTMWFIPTVHATMMLLEEAGFNESQELGRKTDRVIIKAWDANPDANRRRIENIRRVGDVTWQGRR